MAAQYRILPAFLVLGCVGAQLLSVLYHQHFGPGADPEVSAAELPAALILAPAEVMPGSADLGSGWVAAVLARPLFEPRRRPPVIADGTPLQPLPRLAGVVVGPFGKRALFVGADGGNPHWVKEGDAIDSYVVQSIMSGQAILLGPGGQRVLRPTFDAGAVTTRIAFDAVAR